MFSSMLFSKAKLGELIISNVVIPENGKIQVVNKSPRYAESGEPIQGSVAKISCQFVDTALSKIIEKSGADIADLKSYPLEIIGVEQDLIEISTSDLIGEEIALNEAKVMLRWELK